MLYYTGGKELLHPFVGYICATAPYRTTLLVKQALSLNHDLEAVSGCGFGLWGYIGGSCVSDLSDMRNARTGMNC